MTAAPVWSQDCRIQCSGIQWQLALHQGSDSIKTLTAQQCQIHLTLSCYSQL